MEKLYTVSKNKTRSWLWLRSWTPYCQFRLKLKKVGKNTRLFRYGLNQSPYDYTVEVRNRFKGLDLIDRVPDELWTEVHDIVQATECLKHQKFVVLQFWWWEMWNQIVGRVSFFWKLRGKILFQTSLWLADLCLYVHMTFSLSMRLPPVFPPSRRETSHIGLRLTLMLLLT